MLRALSLVLVTIFLTACATSDDAVTENASEALTNHASINKHVSSLEDGESIYKNNKQSPAVKHVTGLSKEMVPNAVMAEPVVISFSKLSAKLDSLAQRQIDSIDVRAKQATSIVVTGYCNKKEIRNAEAAAKARATMIKKELSKLGVADEKIIIKTNITDARHAVLVEFK